MKKVGNDYETWEYTKCVARASETYNGVLVFDVMYFDDYGKGSAVGCTSCGYPAYPNYKTSCSLFDD